MPSKIDFDLHCAGCGYNLRTLLRDGACSECGRDIESSFAADLVRRTELGRLQLCGLPWLRVMERGVWVAFIAWVLSLTGMGYELWTRPVPPYGALAGVIWLLPLMATYVVSHLAAWRLAALGKHWAWRWSIRFATLVSVFAIGLLFVNDRWSFYYRELLQSWLARPSDETMLAVQAIGRIAAVFWPMVTLYVFVRWVQLAVLARRVPTAIVLSLFALVTTGFNAIVAWAFLFHGGIGPRNNVSGDAVFFLLGPTGTLPVVWGVAAYGVQRIPSLLRNPQLEDGVSIILSSFGLAAASLLLGVLLLSLLRTLRRAIRLCESAADHSPR